MLTVVWDVDDVLNDLMSSWFHKAWLPVHPTCGLSYREITENPPHRVLGISQADYLASVDEFRVSDTARVMTPQPDILDWFRSHGANFRHVALTARPLQNAPHAAEWLFRHFGAYIRVFGVVPTRFDGAEPVYDRDKADFLRWLGHADLFIDDSAANVSAARDTGIQSILYPQPWNDSRLSVAETLQTLTEATCTLESAR